jgi:serine/threonine protein kinase
MAVADDQPQDMDTTTVVAPAQQMGSTVFRRQQHRAAFDAALKEIFLTQQVQLREPIGAESKETVVYGALYHGEEVAVKVFTLTVDDLRDGISAYGAFKVECEKTMILSRSHPSVVHVIDYGDAELPPDMPQELREFFPLNLVPFMIFEKAAYGSLDRCLRKLGQLPGFTRLTLMEALANATDGIKEAHEHQVAHRDLKPQNILIFGPDRGKIADFGIARWRSRMMRRDTAMLTPRYSSPEQAFHALTGEREGLVGLAGDIYSWAVMVYELVTGRHPFDWAIKGQRDHRAARRALLQAIASNDRRGFVPTGDITFDALIHSCTCDLKHRITDIAVANRVLRQLAQRMRMR